MLGYPEIVTEVVPDQEFFGESALSDPREPSIRLDPAQRELRRMVLDSVPAASSKLAYGHALDHPYGFSAGQPLSRALLQE